ncbi:MAG: OmpA family protein [Pseudomonadota bacterium]
MLQVVTFVVAMATVALGPEDGNDFVLHDSDSAKRSPGAKPAKIETPKAEASKIEATKTEAAMKLIVIDKDKGPVKGVVICLASPVGTKYCTEETDADGRAEVLVPVGQKYDITYLSLGRRDVAATVTVTSEPKQNVKLTLRFKRLPPPPPFVLTGVNFDTGKATIRPESFDRLGIVADFMARKKSAHVEISGHTDNVGNAKANKALSAKRAQACRAYLISKNIDGSRITAVGYGDERPVGPNDTNDGREKNRRIEVVESPPPTP